MHDLSRYQSVLPACILQVMEHVLTGRQPNDGGVVRCECSLEAVSATVSKEGPNNGRVFW